MLPYNEGRAKRLGLYGTSPFFSDPESSQPVNPTGPAQNRSWELTVSALGLSVQATVPATCGILLLSLIWFLGFCSHLPPFDLKYLNQIILFFPLKTVSGLPAPMPMQSRDVIWLDPILCLVRDQFPACSFHYLHCLLFFVLESVKLIPTLRALHLLFPPSGTWLLSLCMEEPVLMSPAQRSDLWPSGIKSFPAFPSSYSLLFYPALFISA